jgi:hypothetical protein
VNMFDDLTNENFASTAEKITEIVKSENAEDFLLLLATLTSKVSKKSKILAKLVREVEKYAPIVEILLDYCNENFLDHQKNGKINEKILAVVNFVGELYNLDLASDDFIKLWFDVLFAAENSSELTIDCITCLIRIVGKSIETKCKEKIEKYFKYFGYVIKNSKEKNQENYTTKIFNFLIKLRANDWEFSDDICNDLIEFYFVKFANDENISLTGIRLRFFIGDSEEIANLVIREIWKILMLKPSESKSCLKVIKEIGILNLQKKIFNDLLMHFFTNRKFAFMAIKQEEFTETIKKRLGNVAKFCAELFSFDFISEEFLSIWLEENVVERLNVEDAAAISSMIGQKVFKSENLDVKLLLLSLDEKIMKEMELTLENMKLEISQIN